MVAAVAHNYFTNLDADIDEICGKEIHVLDTQTGRTAVVQVVDKCDDCWYSEIRLSRSAFEQFQSTSGGTGTFICEWLFL